MTTDTRSDFAFWQTEQGKRILLAGGGALLIGFLLGKRVVRQTVTGIVTKIIAAKLVAKVAQAANLA